MSTTNIPVTTAYRIEQKSQQLTHREVQSDYISNVLVNATTPVGTVWRFELSPQNVGSERLLNLSRLFQEYKFAKAKLTVASNFSTTTNGQFVIAYNANPDFEIQAGPNAAKIAFALPGACSVPVWTPSSTNASLDKSVWKMTDRDSEEKIATTQGVFFVVLQSALNVTSDVVVPILLDFDCNFRKPSVGPPSTTYILPQVSMIREGETETVANCTGWENIVPNTFQCLQIVGTLALGDTIAGVLASNNWTSNKQFVFFETLEHFQNNAPIQLGKINATYPYICPSITLRPF
jgi:hypothetical protein